jgi:ribosomal protein S18
MTSKADTGHAIQAAARLDHLLLLLLLNKLNRPQIPRRTAKTLDSFAKRIRLARALGLIDPATHSDLKTINDVRVVFAHAELPVRFTSAPARIKARRFTGWKPQASARRLFDEAVARAKAAISRRLTV